MRKIFLLFLFFMSAQSRANLSVGTTLSSVTAGRVIPGIHLNYDTSGIGLSLFGTGVQTSLYYQSAWTLDFHWPVLSTTFLAKPLRARVGGGFFSGKSGLRDTPTATTRDSSDFTLGPAFRIVWLPFSGFFVAMDGLYGMLIPSMAVQLSTQDITHLSLGWEF